MVVLEENLKCFKIKLASFRNTWSNQRSKRRKVASIEISNEDNNTPINDAELHVSDSSTTKFLISFDLQIKIKNKDNSLFLEFNVVDTCQKDILCQIVQYVRNKVEIY